MVNAFPAFHVPSESALRRRLSGSVGFLLLGEIVVQLFLLRSILPIRLLMVVTAAVLLLSSGVSLRRIVVPTVPILVWAVLIALFSMLYGKPLTGAIAFTTTLFPMVLWALLLHHSVYFTDLIRFVDSTASRVRIPLFVALLQVIRAFFDSLSSTGQIIQESLAAARVRRGKRSLLVYAAALRQGLLLLLLEPQLRAQALLIRSPDLQYDSDCRSFFRRPLLIILPASAVIAQEILLWPTR